MPWISLDGFPRWNKGKVTHPFHGYKLAKPDDDSEFKARLKRTAMSLEPEFINKAMGSMRKRCRMLVEADGGHIKCD